MKKISKIIFATIMLVSTFIGSNTGINIHAKEIEWINQIDITKEDGSVPEEFQQDENVKVNFNWNFDNEDDFEGEKTLYFPTELNILTSEEISLTNINGSEVGKVVIDKDNHSLSFKLDDNAESYTNLNGTLSIDVKLDAKESAELYFYDHNNAEFTKYLQMEEVVNDSTNNIQPLYVGGTPNQDVSGKFEIDKLTLSVASYHGGPKTSIYEEVGGVSSGVQPALDLQTYGSPTFYFDMSWSLINSADIGFEKGDFINFDICTIKGPDSVVSGMSFGEKILYGDDGKKLAVGTVEKQKVKDGEYKLVYVITFDPDITIDLPSLTDIKGTMDGFATMSGAKAGESIIINRGEDTVAEIERVDPPVGNKPGIGTEIKPSGKSFSIYNDENKLIDWKVLINDYASTQFSISKPYTYKDLIFEEYVDYHQTFNAYPDASWRVNGVAVQFGVPIYLHNNTTNRTFQSNLTTMSGESYINIGSGNAAQNRGFTFIDPGTTSVSMAAAEASVRSTGKTWTIILEDDGSGNERERLIANFGSPSSGNYVKYGDVYDLEKIQDEIDTVKLNADYMIQQGIDNNADEGDELIDSNNLKLKLSEWRELSQACIDSKVYYQTNPPVFTYNGYVTTRVKVDQNETGTVEKVTNGFRVSGGWSTEEYSAEASNGWSGTISGKPTNGDAVIYKADSTYGNSENKDDDTAINGYLENVSFEVYKVGGTTPLKFDYTDGKYVFSNTGATETLTTENGTGRFVINKLAPGNYYLKEVVSPSGFYSGQNERIEFSVADDKITYKLINNEARGVELKKVDETTLDALSGAVFELYKYDTDINNATKVTGFTKTLISGEDWYVHDGTGSDSLTVGSILLSKGKLKVLRLDAGNYYFKEITPPNGYALSDAKYTFTLEDGLPASSPTIVNVGNITNKLYTADGDITFNATKTMSGRDFKSGDEFTFELYKVSGSTETLIESKKITPTSGASASIAFKKLDYTLSDKDQTYTYRIKEKQENTISGVTYSTKIYEGEYKITDNGDGTLSVTKQSGHDLTSGTIVNFVNTYAASGDITFNASKTMSGRDFKFGDTFTFELYQFDGVNETLIDSKTIAPSSGTSASIVFKKLDYTLTDKNQTYTYRIKEKQENTISGVTYSTKVYEGVYKVTDNGDGTLSVTKQSGHDLTSGTIVNFVNTYAASGDVTFNASKTMSGRDFKSGDEFTFELYQVIGSTETLIDSKTITPTSGASASITFKKLDYTLTDKNQTYTYRIKEKQENTISGVTYSTKVYEGAYKITDNGNGTLLVTKESGHDLTSGTIVNFINTYSATGDITFNATKTMNGRSFQSGDTFTFDLYKVEGSTETKIDSKTITPASGTTALIVFDKINYTLADKDQTYTYKIVEKKENISGITYSTAEYKADYRITDNGNGTLSVTRVTGHDLTSATVVDFTNIYGATGNITFKASKTMSGRDFKSGDKFTFDLYRVDIGGDVFLDSKEINPTSGTNDTVTFNTLNYGLTDKDQIYTYKIVERKENINGVTYSTAEHIGSYKITDTGGGTLTVAHESGKDLTSSSVVNFVNTYAAKSDITFNATKTIDGRDFQLGDTFTFELYKINGSTKTLIDTQTITPTSGISAPITFKKQEYTLADKNQIYTYQIVEKKENINGVTYSTAKYEADYKIEDNGDGTLSVTKQSGDDLTSASKIEFINTYAASGDITFNATKTMDGRDFQTGDTFTFELYQINGSTEKVIDTQTITPTSGTTATITFKKLSYTLADKNQTYTYKIVEKKESISGVIYSTAEYKADYKVTDTGNGTLSITKESGHDLTSAAVVDFTNIYGSNGNITFNASKTMSGRDFQKNDTFTFELYRVDSGSDVLIDSKTITPTSGTKDTITFNTLNYGLSDKDQTYTYKIVEKAGNITGITYSTKVYTGTYKISDKGDGTLDVTIVSGDDLTSASIINFVNVYEETKVTGDVELIKLDAQTKTALEGATFNLYRSDDTLIKEGLVSDENGKVIYTGLGVGTYYFKETKAPTGYVLNSQKITFEIRDNQKSVVTLSFENDKIPDKPSIDTPTRDKNVTFRPSKAPRTGDTTNSNYFMFLLLLSGVFATYGFKKNMYKNNK